MVSLIFKFFATLHGLWDLSSLLRDRTQAPPQGKCRVSTNGPAGKSQGTLYL